MDNFNDAEWEENAGEDELFEHHKFKVDNGQEIIRIDKFLLDRLPNTSRNKIQVAARNGNVLANKLPIKVETSNHSKNGAYSEKPKE